MAHFAKIDENNVVEQVIVVGDNNCDGGQYPESEPVGQAFIASLGLEGTWLQTSYNHNFRGSYAGIGMVYDSVNDVFTIPEVEEEEEV